VQVEKAVVSYTGIEPVVDCLETVALPLGEYVSFFDEGTATHRPGFEPGTTVLETAMLPVTPSVQLEAPTGVAPASPWLRTIATSLFVHEAIKLPGAIDKQQAPATINQEATGMMGFVRVSVSEGDTHDLSLDRRLL
jgi:hypothetical protein